MEEDLEIRGPEDITHHLEEKNVHLNHRIKTILDWLKEYLSVIIIIPVVFGGLWQVLELIQNRHSTRYLSKCVW